MRAWRGWSRWPVPYAALTAVLLIEQIARQRGLRWFDPILLVALCVPLAMLRRRPLEATAACVALYFVAAGSGIDFDTATGIFLLIIAPALFVARREPRGRALAGLLVVAAATPVGALLYHGPVALDAVVLFVLPPWVIGRVLHSRDQIVARLASVNAQLAGEREIRAEAAVAAERARIARELHDVVAHALSVMVIQSAGARLAVTRAPDRCEQALDVVGDAGAEAIAEMRRLLGVLRDDAAQRQAHPPGLARLEQLAARAREAGLLLEVDVDPGAERLAPVVDLAAYRIAQEAVTNAVKHAAPTAARLSVRVDGGVVEVTVENDGPAAGRATGAGTGHGLLGIRERVELHGGDLDAGPRPDGGFLVHARLPC